MTAHSHILYISCKMFHLNVSGCKYLCFKFQNMKMLPKGWN